MQTPQTPFVLIDYRRMVNNLETMSNMCSELGLRLRANVSVHQHVGIAQEQMDMGAVGISCLTLAEARQFIDAGITNIQIPANIVGSDQTESLTDLLMMARVTVTVDHTVVVGGLADGTSRYDLSARVLVEVASEEGSSGVSPAEAVTIAKRIEEEETLHFAGIYMNPISPKNYPQLQMTLKLLDEAGIGVDVVSGGGTGFALMAPTMPEVTEVVSGRYALYDWESIAAGWSHPDECALMVNATVVNRPTSERAIINVGWRTLSMFDLNGTYGHILEYPHSVIYQLDAHRAYVDTSRCKEQPVIGEHLHIIPVRTEAVLHQARTIYTVHDGQIVAMQ